MAVPDHPVVDQATDPASPQELLSSLHGLERQPLDVQVELLDAVRKGLDAALGRSVEPDHRG